MLFRSELPLFTTFLFTATREDGTIRFMIRIALFKQQYKKGFLVFGDHLERLPLWSDYLIVQLRETTLSDKQPSLRAGYCWASEQIEPTMEMSLQEAKEPDSVAKYRIPLPGVKFGNFLGPRAAIRIEASEWT